MNQEMGERVIQKYERLIYKVLVKQGIRTTQDDFEDYVQEVRLFLYQLASMEDSIQDFEQAYPLPFLYRKLSWFIQDYRRKLVRFTSRIDLMDEGIEVQTVCARFEEMEVQDAFAAFYASLSLTDRHKLSALLLNPKISRQMRSYYRKQLREKFTQFFPKL